MRRLRMNLPRVLGSIVIWGVATAFALYVALHLLRPDYNPARQFLSAYAIGPFGGLMTAEFFVQALISLALAVGLLLKVRRSRSLLVGCLVLIIVAVTLVILGLFPGNLSDLNGGPLSRSGAIHQFTGMISFPSRIVAFLLLPRAYKYDQQWQAFARTARRVGLAFLGLFIAFVVVVRWDLGGLAQRAAVAVGLLWLLLNGLQLRRSARPADLP